jgi:hypothetical protein
LPDPVQLPSQSFQPMITEVHHWFPFWASSNHCMYHILFP